MTDFDTLAVRSGVHRSQFNEHAEALYLTSSFIFENAAQAAARFSGDEAGPVYSRYTNPTVDMLQERLAALEGAQCCVATASGMSAVLACVMCFTRAGDHIVASRGLFGATVQLLNNWLPRFGVTTTFVSPVDFGQWEAAIKPSTRLLFLETPSNPLTEVGHRGVEQARAARRRAARSGQLFLHPGATAPHRDGCRHRHPFGNQVSRWAGPGDGRRCAR